MFKPYSEAALGTGMLHAAWGLPQALWQGSPPTGDLARRLYTLEALQPPLQAQETTEPYSLPWFLSIERHRHGKQARWIPQILEFTKHNHETLLGLGDGLGTDWVQYAQHGAHVVVCSTSAPQLSLVRRNFEVRGLKGRFLNAHPARLPLDSASIDVACISSLHRGIDAPQQVIDEVFRVLKPGGKVLAVTPAKFDIHYWTRALCFWQKKPAEAEECYTGASLRSLFQSFGEQRIYKRHLRRSEVPGLWRWIPTGFLARLVGRVLVFKGFKPLRETLPMKAAA